MNKKKVRKSPALSTINRLYPQVKELIDASKPIVIEVTEADEKISRKMDHTECAMAVACKRQFHCQGVVIARTTAYIVNGPVALRYRVPESAGREVVSFDRGGGFSPGTYRLIPNINKLGHRHKGDPREGKKSHSGNLSKRFQHITANIRPFLTFHQV